MCTTWRQKTLLLKEINQAALILIVFSASCYCWLPDTSAKVVNTIGHISTYKFFGNSTYPDYFVVVHQDNNSILLGGRNTVYNLSVYDFTERKESRIEWTSTEAHGQLCILKGKTEDDCQNYIRILAISPQKQVLVCGTNSYKPLCRYYSHKNGKYTVDKEFEGIGICPYDPEHNSTAIYSNGQLYSATVADFSGGDPLIYREPQRTELSDLKQLNGPNFVSSILFEDYVFFFYRETAVEYINCGKIIYSRVARVCKDDKGGPHQFRDRWTSFLKTRLNCSVPGEYPFYFDEIQSTSDIIEGYYNLSKSPDKIIYGTLTTPINAIGGSAVCAYSMSDILKAFDGTFKHQESMNSNWLPIPEDKIPKPKPGRCVRDSRLLPENIINFVKSHSLMENAVPALFGGPILIRVSQQYRFTAITVDPQVETINDGHLDVLYIGTDDGKVLKVVNIITPTTKKAVVISENTILPNNAPVKQLKVAPGYGKIIVVGKVEARLANLNNCGSNNVLRCNECVMLQDPHCAWDFQNSVCVSLDVATSKRSLIQDIERGDPRRCLTPPNGNKRIPIYKDDVNEIVPELQNTSNNDNSVTTSTNRECENNLETNEIAGCAVQQRLVIAGTLHLVVFAACSVCVILGFIAGFWISRRFHPQTQYPNAPYIEQHNHLDRLTPRANKSVNLNVPQNPPPPKKDNLDASKDLNIASDGTLQKIKKTYI